MEQNTSSNKSRSSRRRYRNRHGRKRNHGGGSRGYSNKGYRRGHQSRNRRFRGEYIPHDKYIAKAEVGFVAPSIFAEDKVYDDFDVCNILKKNIAKKGYVHPTKIQNEAIPEILAGKDILGLADTGSGKTGAFLIPILNKAIRDNTQKCLIIVPTRELAAQIQDEFRELARDAGMYSTLIIGGMSMGRQIHQLRRRPQFVIGTPGRLKDLYDRNILRLEDFNNIILDEVDRMLDMGFVPDITYLISKLTDKKQTLFFSATMSPEAEKIARTLLRDPIKVQVAKESPLKSVDQDIVKYTNPDDKMNKLVEILKKEEANKVLIFTRTKRWADKLSKKLWQRDFKADAIHGDKSQNKRQRVLTDFKNNKLDILVATDVAARGLDIPNVSHVINYDEPENYKDYIHRIGRTGRAGKTGNALTFVQ